jgi:3',5'-cyclic-AMP phosphodiesterase
MRSSRCSVLFVTVFLFAVWSGCDRPFVYSPFEARVPEAYRGTTENHLALIKEITTGEEETLRVALLADTHYHFNSLVEAIKHINARNTAAFAIVVGDFTENGLLTEYILFHDIMKQLAVPYITVIGNHDYLSTGGIIYEQMYGPYNYTFAINRIKFVIFDNVFWESKKLPDFAWLEQALEDHEAYDHVIPFAHIPPFDKQFVNHRYLYHDIIRKAGIQLSIHGHKHDYFLGDLYGDGSEYLTVPSPQKRSYCELVISPSGIQVEKIDY